MKSLNRTLSLVLVLVMVFGLFGVASASSSTYTDASSVGAAYAEAVDLLTGIGVVNGTTSTTLDPTAVYTREQAAKVICYLTLGKTTADALKCSVAPFSDVAADRWSAGYIQYCVSQGIINGMGDGTFAPEASLTGYAWGKMLLCALGYGKDSEFTGTGWEIAVAKQGFTLKLFTGDSAAATGTSITRQQAMLLGYNTLFLGTVKANYDRDNGVKYVSSYTNPGASFANTVYGFAQTSGNEALYTAASSTGLAKVSADANGASGYKWYYKNTTTAATGFYTGETVLGSSFAATPLIGTGSLTVYSTTNTKYIATLDAAATYYLNGTQAVAFVADTAYDKDTVFFVSDVLYKATSAITVVDSYANIAEAVAGSDAALVVALANPGYGVAIKLVDNDDVTTDAEKVYVTTYYVDTVASAPVVKTNPANGYSYVYISMDTTPIGSSTGYTVLASKVTGYTGLAADDVVTVTANADGSYVITKCATLSGTATAITTSNGNSALTVDGTKYPVAKKGDATVTGFSAYKVAYTFYKDAYGFLVYGVATGDASTTYAAVLDAAYTTGGLAAASTMKAQLLLTDGTTKIVDVSYVNGEKVDLTTGLTATLDGAGAAPSTLTVETYFDAHDNEFFKYSVATDGTYALTLTGAAYDATTTAYTAGTIAMNGFAVNAGTKVIIATTVASATKYTVYTGYSAVPSIAANYGVSYQTNSSGAVTYVYVDATGGVAVGDTSANYVYILSTTYTTDNSGDTTLYYFPAIFNGAVTSVPTASTAVRDILDNGQGLYTITASTTGVITSVPSGAEETANVVSAKAAGGIFETKAYDGTETVWLINLAAKTADKGLITNITTDYSATVVTYTTGTAAHQQTIQFVFAEA